MFCPNKQRYSEPFICLDQVHTQIMIIKQNRPKRTINKTHTQNKQLKPGRCEGSQQSKTKKNQKNPESKQIKHKLICLLSTSSLEKQQNSQRGLALVVFFKDVRLDQRNNNENVLSVTYDHLRRC